MIDANFPHLTGRILSSQTRAPEVTLWVYNRNKRTPQDHSRIGGISWDRTNDLYDVNVAL